MQSEKEKWLSSLEGKYPQSVINIYRNYPESIREKDNYGIPINNEYFINGLRNGQHIFNCPVQNILSSKQGYKEGFYHGEHTYYYPSGSLYSTCTYLNGFINGMYMEYYENGKPFCIYNKDGRGNYNGEYVIYDINGNIKWQETYINNLGQRTGHIATNTFIEPRLCYIL